MMDTDFSTLKENVVCPSCGQNVTQNYCSSCGEERLKPERRSLNYLIKGLFSDLTSVDGKWFSTLKLIAVQPGQFETNYCNGRRVAYLKPITFFLMVNVIFVFLSPLTDFYVNLLDQVTLQPYSNELNFWLKQVLLDQGIQYKEFELHYNQIVKVLARSIIILQAPIYALFIGIICFKKSKFFTDYLIFSLNFHAWLLLWVIVAQLPTIVLTPLINLIFPEQTLWNVYLALLPIGVSVYLYIAIKRFFQFNWWSSAIRTVLVIISYRFAHTAFRLLQFFITYSVVEVPIIAEVLS